MANDQLVPLGPRLSNGRLLGLVVLAIGTASAGWITGTGFVRAFGEDACGPEQSCGGIGVAVHLAGGILGWLAALVGTATTAHGDGPLDGDSATSDRGVLLGCLALGLAGASFANNTFHPWPLAPVAPLALATAGLDRFAARRWRTARLEQHRKAEQEHRLAEFGVTVPGVVVAVGGDGSLQDGDPVLLLTVEFTAAGTVHTTTVTGTFPGPGAGAPLRGSPAEVRYDPADPAVARATVTGPAPAPADAVPAPAPAAGAAPEIVDGLERLTALHRQGALDAAEFALAKAQLLGRAPVDEHR
ncbi:SHOCT domain-containing protein [Kitasatospora sp. NBC_00458]|uniref:SHOCT domain-containing protein n=1 Tax=Kitasatospora sp. NBC_00458 TaxID=2903568 RepID=UPI002E18672B